MEDKARGLDKTLQIVLRMGNFEKAKGTIHGSKAYQLLMCSATFSK